MGSCLPKVVTCPGETREEKRGPWERGRYVRRRVIPSVILILYLKLVMSSVKTVIAKIIVFQRRLQFQGRILPYLDCILNKRVAFWRSLEGFVLTKTANTASYADQNCATDGHTC